MTIPNEIFINQLHPAQIELLTLFDKGTHRFFDEEWHRKARKTTLAINLLIREACRYPSTVWTYIGPTIKQAREIVWDDPNMLNAYLPDLREMRWKRDESKLHIKFANKSLLRIIGAAEILSLRGPDTEGVVFDEWALMDREVWQAVFEPVIRLKPNRWAMFLWTPIGLNHATEAQAKRRLNPDWHVKTLKASESNIINPDELRKAKASMPATLYDQEYECAHITDEEMTLITSRMLDALKNRQPFVELPAKCLISVDPGLGGDKCAIKYFNDTKVIDKKDVRSPDVKVVIGECMLMAAKHNCNTFVMDTCGIGSPLASMLEQHGKIVIAINAAEQAEDPKRFANRKAEMWWYVAQLVNEHETCYPDDLETLNQIPIASQYKIVSGDGKIRMRLKDDTRKQLGRSPDDADCWVMGIYGLQFVEKSWTKDLMPLTTTVEQDNKACDYNIMEL